MKITKTFQFHAAHKDDDATDQCGRLHGHTYKLEMTVVGHTNGSMLIHGDILKEIYREDMEPVLEHQYLNDTLPCNPTMENTTRWLIKQLIASLKERASDAQTIPSWWMEAEVTLWETPTMFCTLKEHL